MKQINFSGYNITWDKNEYVAKGALGEEWISKDGENWVKTKCEQVTPLIPPTSLLEQIKKDRWKMAKYLMDAGVVDNISSNDISYDNNVYTCKKYGREWKSMDGKNWIEVIKPIPPNTSSHVKKSSLEEYFDCKNKNSVRNYNVGNSDYSKHKIQPWDIWIEYKLNPFDADIVKRILRKKAESGMSEQESRKMDYQKIIHICEERIRQIDEGIEL